MPSKRKRPRRRLRQQPFLWIALLASLYLGVTRSPLTSVRHVRVQGAQPFDQSRIDGDLQKLVGIPCLQINPRETEARVLSLPELRSASLSRSIFGNAVLSVEYRTPVARLTIPGNLALSADGVIYPVHFMPAGLPTLDLPPGARAPVLTLSGTLGPQDIARLAEMVKGMSKTDPESIRVDGTGRVKLLIGSGSVELGSCDKLEEKIRVLKDRLSRNPEELSQIAELNLTVPERPAFTPKTSRVSKKEQQL